MPSVSTELDEEPVRAFVASLVVILNLGLGAAALFDWVPLTAAQVAALAAFVTAVAVLVAKTLRAHVWSPATVRAAGIAT